MTPEELKRLENKIDNIYGNIRYIECLVDDLEKKSYTRTMVLGFLSILNFAILLFLLAR
jgi:hypothetical protein